jgi:hypothetical protein
MQVLELASSAARVAAASCAKQNSRRGSGRGRAVVQQRQDRGTLQEIADGRRPIAFGGLEAQPRRQHRGLHAQAGCDSSRLSARTPCVRQDRPLGRWIAAKLAGLSANSRARSRMVFKSRSFASLSNHESS